MPSNDNCFEHWDSVKNIKLLEDRDLALLVSKGVARQIPPSNGHLHESMRYSRVYEIYLKKTIAPQFAKDKVEIHFWYDLTTNKGTLRIKKRDFDRLSNRLNKVSNKEFAVRFGYPQERRFPVKQEVEI